MTTAGQRAAAALAGAGLGGGIYGGIDALHGVAAGTLAGARVGVALALTGLCLGALAGLPGVALRASRAGGRAGRVGAALAAALALAAGAVDAWVYVGLYPMAHGWLAAAGLGAAGLAGALGAGPRLAKGAAVILPLAGAAPWLAPAVVGSSWVARQQVQARGTGPARALAQRLPATAAPITDQPCTFPAAAPPPAGGQAKGAPVILLTIDALRGDLPLAEVMPKTHARLAGATRFDRAYAAATRTTRSIYALFTGLYPHRVRFEPTRVDGQDAPVVDPGQPGFADPQSWKMRTPTPLNDRSPTLPALLEAAGVPTFTSIAYVYFRPHFGVTRGFGGVSIGPYLKTNRDNRGVTSGALTERLRRYVAEAPAQFFLWAHYMDPHRPYDAYGDVPADAPLQARYRSELRRVDDALEPLWADLAARGVLDRAVVILSADHGEAFGEHGASFHGTSVYDEQARVPLWVRAPGGAGGAVAAPVSLVDLAPTILDLLGVAGAPAMDGRSLAPALFGAPLPPRPVLTSATLNGHRLGLIDGDHKLMADTTEGWIALYDLRADPGERHTLADAEPTTRDRLLCLLRAAGVPLGAAGGGPP